MRDALGIQAGDSLRYVISEDGVQVLKMPLEKAQADDPALSQAADAAGVVMDENRSLLKALK